ncbi:hypothetical protein [Nocardia sp. NPDC049526]|uniref:hypothetical protein n=1 Tax=Nocardia sp. NPDC049526 TaxID=3364316 RepID=UPI0037B7A2E9
MDDEAMIGGMVFRRTMFAAIVAALVLVVCTSASSPTPTLNRQPCQENAEFDCATVTVPIGPTAMVRRSISP